MTVSLYTKKGCSNCILVKEMFHRIGKKIDIIEVKSLANVAMNNEHLEDDLVDIKSFPIVIDENWVGEFQAIIDKYDEPLLSPTEDRFTLYPVKFPKLFNMHLQGRRSFWQPEEIDFSKDEKDWISMTEKERQFVCYILAFFAGADGIVMENLATNFAKEVQIPEARAFYAIQMGVEAIHNETYGLILDKYVKDPQKKEELQQGIQRIPSVKKKAEWALKWIENKPFNKRLVAFACVEGIFFSGSFCAIFWLKKRGLLPGLTFSNELIARDEGLHTNFAVALHDYLKNTIKQEEAHAMITDAVNVEMDFITEALSCDLIGMNCTLMKQYIKYVADRLLVELGYDPIWMLKNPFDFMETISLGGKTNFFEKKVGEYAKNHGSEECIFSLDSEF